MIYKNTLLLITNKAGYENDHWFQLHTVDLTFHLNMWECVDMQKQSLKSSSALSIQHEKQLPTDSQMTHDSSCFSLSPDNTACTMTGGCSIQSSCHSIPL